MSSEYNPIIKKLDPRIMAERIDRTHDNANKSYRPPGTTPRSFPEFRSWLKDCYEFHCTATGMGSFPEEVSTVQATKIVESAFGSNGGIVGAYETARVGMDRGIYASFDAIAHYLKEYHRKMYIQHIIDTYINPVDFNQKVALVRALLKSYPSPGDGYAKVSAEELASNYYALIADLVQRLKSYIPNYYRIRE